jgi:MFS family permease
MASSFRFVTMLTCDYFYPAYMLMAFPRHTTQFLSYNAIITFCCGLFAALSGGIIAERFGRKSPRNYAKICALGSLIAWPCMVVGLTTTNFHLAIAMLFCKYAFGENHWAPNLQMIKNSCKSTELGSYIGAN